MENKTTNQENNLRPQFLLKCINYSKCSNDTRVFQLPSKEYYHRIYADVQRSPNLDGKTKVGKKGFGTCHAVSL